MDRDLSKRQSELGNHWRHDICYSSKWNSVVAEAAIEEEKLEM
jgi:hypothetical protein